MPLHSGELFGNRFVIVLRNVTAARRNIIDVLEKTASRGFINYYGMQRFGAGSVRASSLFDERIYLFGGFKIFFQVLTHASSEKRCVKALFFLRSVILEAWLRESSIMIQA